MNYSIPLSMTRRPMGTLAASEEFPGTPVTVPGALGSGKISTKTLSNGVTVMAKDSTGGVVDLKISVKGGSSAECASTKGAAHLLSVGAFGGTANRSGLALCRSLEDLGATFSASADRSAISYNLSVSPENVEDAFSLVAEAVTSPPAATYVLDELKSAVSDLYSSLSTSQQLSELAHSAAFGENSPLGGSIYASSASALSGAAALDYRAANYKAGNVVVSASGISADSLAGLAEAGLGSMSGEAQVPPAVAYVGGSDKAKADIGGGALLSVALPVPANGSAQVLQTVLAGRLEGLPVHVSVHSYASTGLLEVQASSIGMLEAAMNELKACAAGVSSVDAYVSKLVLAHAVQLDGCGAAGAVESSAAAARLSSVKAADVSSAAASALKATPTYTAIGDVAAAPSYDEVKALI